MSISTTPLVHIYRDGRHFVQSRATGEEYEWGSIGLMHLGASSQQQPAAAPSSTPPAAVVVVPLSTRIDEQRDALIQNTTLFLTIQYLWENTCKQPSQPSNYAFYTSMLEKARIRAKTQLAGSSPGSLPEQAIYAKTFERELEKVFLEEVSQHHHKRVLAIEESALAFSSSPLTSLNLRLVTLLKIRLLQVEHLYVKVKARAIYFLFNRCIQFVVQKLISTHINMLRKYKDAIRKDEFCTFKNELIDNLTRTLTILNGAYTTVARKSSTTGLISEMVAEELNRASANKQRTAEQLYGEAADTLIQSTLGRYRGRLASWLLQKFMTPGAIVESLIQSVAGSGKDNKGYSHAITSLALDQLLSIEQLLQNPEAPTTPVPTSEERARQLSVIIYELLEILHKSECATVNQLTHVVQGTGAPLDGLRRYLETYGMSVLMNHIVLKISDLIESNVNEDQIDQLTFQILKLTNDSFAPMKKPSPETMKQTEEELAAVTQRILRQAIEKGFDDSLSSTEASFGAFYLPRPLTMCQKAFFWAPLRAFAKRAPLIHPTATKKVSGLLRILAERNTYICALHHLVLLPYIEKMNPTR